MIRVALVLDGLIRSNRFADSRGSPDSSRIVSGFPNGRESETTIKIKFALFRGGWAGGQGGKLSKTLFFVGNATTIKFSK